MFKIEAGKKYVCRDGSIVTLTAAGVYLKGNDWLFSAKIPDKDGYRVFSHREHHHDIVAPYVENKPRKASSPYKKLLTAKEGDIFLLKGEKFIVSEYPDAFLKELQGKVYLTSLERKNNHDYPSAHVRDSKNKALFLRGELIDLLRSGEYVIK